MHRPHSALTARKGPGTPVTANRQDLRTLRKPHPFAAGWCPCRAPKRLRGNRIGTGAGTVLRFSAVNGFSRRRQDPSSCDFPGALPVSLHRVHRTWWGGLQPGPSAKKAQEKQKTGGPLPPICAAQVRPRGSPASATLSGGRFKPGLPHRRTTDTADTAGCRE